MKSKLFFYPIEIQETSRFYSKINMTNESNQNPGLSVSVQPAFCQLNTTNKMFLGGDIPREYSLMQVILLKYSLVILGDHNRGKNPFLLFFPNNLLAWHATSSHTWHQPSLSRTFSSFQLLCFSIHKSPTGSLLKAKPPKENITVSAAANMREGEKC